MKRWEAEGMINACQAWLGCLLERVQLHRQLNQECHCWRSTGREGGE